MPSKKIFAYSVIAILVIIALFKAPYFRFAGIVLDAKTKNPIDGAIVVMRLPGIEFFDGQITLGKYYTTHTNSKGKFSIYYRRKKGEVDIFKKGYNTFGDDQPDLYEDSLIEHSLKRYTFLLNAAKNKEEIFNASKHGQFSGYCHEIENAATTAPCKELFYDEELCIKSFTQWKERKKEYESWPICADFLRRQKNSLFCKTFGNEPGTTDPNSGEVTSLCAYAI